MKRLIGALLLTLGLVAGPLTAVNAAPTPKDCATVDVATGSYSDVSGVATLTVEFNLGEEACRRTTYRVQALTTAGDELGSSSELVPNGSEVGSYRIAVGVGPVTTAPTAVCAVLTVGSGKKVYDDVPTNDSHECTGAAGGTYITFGPSGASGMR